MTDVPFVPELTLFRSCIQTLEDSDVAVTVSTVNRNDNGKDTPLLALPHNDNIHCQSLYKSFCVHYYPKEKHRKENDSVLSQDSRYQTFLSNVMFIHNHNKRREETNGPTHEVSLNQFSDVMDNELPLIKSDVWESVTLDDITTNGGGAKDHRRLINSMMNDRNDNDINGIEIIDWETLSDQIKLAQLKKHHHSDKKYKKKNKSKPHQKNNIAPPLWFHEDTNSTTNDFSTHLNWATSHNPDGISIVHPASDQGACGSCWAFATTGTLEASVARNTAWEAYIKTREGRMNVRIKDDVDAINATKEAMRAAQLAERAAIIKANLSVQELLDCDSIEYGWYDQGCAGGNPLFASFFISRFGLASANDYPYRGDQRLCRVDKASHPIASVRQWATLPSYPNFEENMEIVLRYLGPVAVGLNGADPSFLHYKGGIYANFDCAPTPNHAMLIVGYGTDVDITTNTTTKFWIARNSWGRGWGEDGFVRMARGREVGDAGICGIDQSPSVALGGFFIESVDYAKKLSSSSNDNSASQDGLSFQEEDGGVRSETTYAMPNFVLWRDLFWFGIVVILGVFYFLKEERARNKNDSHSGIHSATNEIENQNDMHLESSLLNDSKKHVVVYGSHGPGA